MKISSASLTPRALKIFAIIFGILHLFGMYALLLLGMGNAMATFDGGQGTLSVGAERLFMTIVGILLFPFGYLHIPLIGPWINSVFWAYIVYRVMKYFFVKKSAEANPV